MRWRFWIAQPNKPMLICHLRHYNIRMWELLTDITVTGKKMTLMWSWLLIAMIIHQYEGSYWWAEQLCLIHHHHGLHVVSSCWFCFQASCLSGHPISHQPAVLYKFITSIVQIKGFSESFNETESILLLNHNIADANGNRKRPTCLTVPIGYSFNNKCVQFRQVHRKKGNGSSTVCEWQ